MRIATSVLLIILALTACGSPQPAAPILQPLPIPIGTTPVPVDTAAAGTPASISTEGLPGVSSGSAVAPCACPAGTLPPAQTQTAVAGAPTVICNCPASLVPPPQPGPLAGSTPQILPANGIVMADNGKTFILHPGESFLLNLGTDAFDWSVNIDNQDVLAMRKGVMVIQGAQGIYQANTPGQAVLTAVGTPVCRKTGQMCMALAILFKITVIVQ